MDGVREQGNTVRVLSSLPALVPSSPALSSHRPEKGHSAGSAVVLREKVGSLSTALFAVQCLSFATRRDRMRVGLPASGLVECIYRKMAFRQVCQNPALVCHSTQSWKKSMSNNNRYHKYKGKEEGCFFLTKSNLLSPSQIQSCLCSMLAKSDLSSFLIILVLRQVKRGEEKRGNWKVGVHPPELLSSFAYRV